MESNWRKDDWNMRVFVLERQRVWVREREGEGERSEKEYIWKTIIKKPWRNGCSSFATATCINEYLRCTQARVTVCSSKATDQTFEVQVSI